MSTLSALQRKKTKFVVGLMSGTSADGIDAALVRISGRGTSTRVRQVAFGTYPYPPRLRELVLQNSLPGRGNVNTLCDLNVLIAHLFSDAVRKIARKGRVALADIDLIGSHGQTVHHRPGPTRAFGRIIRSTLQIGDPSTIAKLTGIPTVGDFRLADMAVGGQGAPLVPYFDYLMFRSKTKNRILLNLGGIANITALPKNCSVKQVLAFDTGPGNMIIDALMMRLYGKKHDTGGRTAAKGSVVPRLLFDLMSLPYFKQRPPKSTGRELFGATLLSKILKQRPRLRREDLIATVTELTSLAVFDQYQRFVADRMSADEVLVSGGGVHNRAIMEALKDYFQPAHVRSLESAGFSADAKEAVCFAVLANETVSERPGNLPGATGATRPVILGKICL